MQILQELPQKVIALEEEDSLLEAEEEVPSVEAEAEVASVNEKFNFKIMINI